MSSGRASTLLVVAVVTGLAGLGACGGGMSAQGGIQPADVTGLGPGDAVGTAFSGNYLYVAGTAAYQCACRTGLCADLPSYSPGQLWVVAQQDGAVTLAMRRGSFTPLACLGGVDSLGHLRCGEVLGDTASARVLYLIDGQMTVANGVVQSFAAEMKLTTRQTDDLGRFFDCDVAVIGQYHPLM